MCNMENGYKQGLSAADKARYEDKLKIVYADSGVDILDPFEIPQESWIDNIHLWPPVEYGQLFNYLIDTPGPFTREKLKAYRSLEAYNYYIRYTYI